MCGHYFEKVITSVCVDTSFWILKLARFTSKCVGTNLKKLLLAFVWTQVFEFWSFETFLLQAVVSVLATTSRFSSEVLIRKTTSEFRFQNVCKVSNTIHRVKAITSVCVDTSFWILKLACNIQVPICSCFWSGSSSLMLRTENPGSFSSRLLVATCIFWILGLF